MSSSNHQAAEATRQDQTVIATRRRILAAARDAINRRGLFGLSMDSVATLSGCSRRTVYNHFENRTALFREVMSDTLTKVECEVHVDLNPTLPVAIAVRLICATALGAMRSAEFAELRRSIERDGLEAQWLSAAFERRVMWPLNFAVMSFLKSSAEVQLVDVERERFCASMMATLEAASGAGTHLSAAPPFTVDEIAEVILGRLTTDRELENA